MELEIFLDIAEVKPENLTKVEDRFQQWYAEGAEIRYNKQSFGYLTRLEQPNRYLVDIGNVELTTAFSELHARVYRFGAKVFIHFLP
jgi:hypothetical protein